MSEKELISHIQTRLSEFVDEINHVDPDKVSVEDIDEWIGLLDQLEEKVKTVQHEK
ncbi:SE1561 family protein [Staphylococcus carnosus]|uniref:SE1561 family protein n=1 Tax=Staphylococcus carnosus TaxID=1281 RepID=UPI001F42DE42|nr:SE1561 family protein [Staphylococcus carnosus]